MGFFLFNLRFLNLKKSINTLIDRLYKDWKLCITKELKKKAIGNVTGCGVVLFVVVFFFKKKIRSIKQKFCLLYILYQPNYVRTYATQRHDMGIDSRLCASVSLFLSFNEGE